MRVAHTVVALSALHVGAELLYMDGMYVRTEAGMLC
jgi:hypothetical protein